MDESLIRSVPLFSTLPPEQIAFLTATFPVNAYNPPTILFQEGDTGDRVYIILAGQIAIVKALGTDDERLLAVRGKGEVVGEMSLLADDGLRTASARVQDEAHVLELRRTDFDALLDRHPPLAYSMLRVLSNRLRNSHDATVRDLHERNERLARAYADLQAAQAQLIEKEALERELGVAREIQQSMLPRVLPQVPGYDLGALMAPAREVAGDFFDVIPLTDGRLGLVIGDVCGKGVPAALFMALTRALLRAEVVRTPSPEQVLRNLNQQIQELSNSGLFVTLLYGVLDGVEGTFSYVRAGHEIPLCWDGAGVPLEVPRGLGYPLGLFPNPALDSQTLVLPPGGTLLLFTDGVTEAADAMGEFFGLERIHNAMSDYPTASAQERCNQLLATLTTYRGAVPQADDITLVLVQRR